MASVDPTHSVLFVSYIQWPLYTLHIEAYTVGHTEAYIVGYAEARIVGNAEAYIVGCAEA